MKKYQIILIAVMLIVSLTACGQPAPATEAPAGADVPVDSGVPADPGSPADPGTAATPAPDNSGLSDPMDGFLFAPMSGETAPKDDVNYFVAILRERSEISGDLQLISAVPAATTWETVLAHYEQQAKNNGWVLEKVEEVKVQGGYLCTVALFTHGDNKILIAYYPLNGVVNILQIQGR